jgi:hypothetical protein
VDADILHTRQALIQAFFGLPVSRGGVTSFFPPFSKKGFSDRHADVPQIPDRRKEL